MIKKFKIKIISNNDKTIKSFIMKVKFLNNNNSVPQDFSFREDMSKSTLLKNY